MVRISPSLSANYLKGPLGPFCGWSVTGGPWLVVGWAVAGNVPEPAAYNPPLTTDDEQNYLKGALTAPLWVVSFSAGKSQDWPLCSIFVHSL